MSSFREGVLAAALVLPGAGCSTVATLLGAAEPEGYGCSDDRLVPRVYSGVFNDVAILRGESVEKLVVVCDLPFSLVADTLVLPYTLYAQIRYGNLCPREVDDASQVEQQQ